jgi:hypothetical protein
MPNHQPYQNQPGGPAARPQGQRPESGAAPSQSAGTQQPSTTLGQPQSSGQQSGGQPNIGQQNIGQPKPPEGNQSFADRAGKAVDQVKTSAIERVGDVRTRAEAGIADQRGKIVERVQRVGDMLLGASQQMRHEDEFVATALEAASERIGRAATYVGSMDTRRLASDAQRFARTHPAWFIGGAFVAGLALGRFLKSSPSSSMGSAEIPPSNFDEEERW